MLIRPETLADHHAVDVVTREAFWNLYRPGCDEHYTTHLIRQHEDHLPELSFVAEVDGQIVGSIICTRSSVSDEHGPWCRRFPLVRCVCILPGRGAGWGVR